MIIERIIRDRLQREIYLPVFLEKPDSSEADLPERYVTIEKTGGSRENHAINRSTLAIQSYATTREKAAELNETVKDKMLEKLVELRQIGSIRLNSDYDFTDTQTKKYRYQAVFEVTHY